MPALTALEVHSAADEHLERLGARALAAFPARRGLSACTRRDIRLDRRMHVAVAGTAGARGEAGAARSGAEAEAGPL